MKQSVPYIILKQEDNIEYRLFSKYDPKSFFWHKDHENRVVRLMSGHCSFQRDNELPIDMNPGDELNIGKDVMHRLIGDGSPFIMAITKL